jgi:hypothetical protein
MARRPRQGANFPPDTRSTTARGYGFRHQAERRRSVPLVEAGGVLCARCHLPIPSGSRWHLDHEDDGVHYRGPAHASCNVKAAARRGNELARESKAPSPSRAVRIHSRDW